MDGQLFPQPIPSGVTLQTNGSTNGSQSLLNLKPGTGVTVTDDGVGGVTIAGTVSAVTLKTNGVSNGSQTVLNLIPGANITITDGGSGNVTIAGISQYVPTPATATSTGTAGQWSYDSSFFYVCTATNTWARVGIAAW